MAAEAANELRNAVREVDSIRYRQWDDYRAVANELEGPLFDKSVDRLVSERVVAKTTCDQILLGI